ncbi:MAG: carboxypeptidase-like regulatory domain-containing protein [Acidobacteriota bacterium]
MFHKKSTLITMIVVIILLGATVIDAQVTTATIYANVTDASGAKLGGATVTITSEQTYSTQSAMTNSDGEFTFNFLQLGIYRLSISAKGFKEQNQGSIEVSGGQRLRLSYALEVGSLSEKVTFTSEQPVISAVNAEQLISHDATEVRGNPTQFDPWSTS